MSRVMIDCRTMPSESGCSLTLTGEPEEVLRAAAAHAVDVHGHTDDEELRDALRSAMVPTPELDLREGEFVQTISYRTQRIEEMEAMEQQWVDAIGEARTARWGVIAADRGDPGRYVQIVAFPSHDAAMANSKHPATSEFAARLGALCEGEATFSDLDVRHVTRF